MTPLNSRSKQRELMKIQNKTNDFSNVIILQQIIYNLKIFKWSNEIISNNHSLTRMSAIKKEHNTKNTKMCFHNN